MSEFEDRNGNLLTGSARRRAVRMDGMSRRELRLRERIDGREVNRESDAPRECWGCEAELDCEFRFDRKRCGEEDR